MKLNMSLVDKYATGAAAFLNAISSVRIAGIDTFKARLESAVSGYHPNEVAAGISAFIADDKARGEKSAQMIIAETHGILDDMGVGEDMFRQMVLSGISYTAIIQARVEALRYASDAVADLQTSDLPEVPGIKRDFVRDGMRRMMSSLVEAATTPEAAAAKFMDTLQVTIPQTATLDQDQLDMLASVASIQSLSVLRGHVKALADEGVEISQENQDLLKQAETDLCQAINQGLIVNLQNAFDLREIHPRTSEPDSTSNFEPA